MDEEGRWSGSIACCPPGQAGSASATDHDAQAYKSAKPKEPQIPRFVRRNGLARDDGEMDESGPRNDAAPDWEKADRENEMPKRVIDFDALWASDKLASCAEWAQSEYAWLYGLADASGSFEMTNLRVIWGRVAAVRKNLSLERLGEIFDEFIARGLLFTWEEKGKRYGHWTGSDVPGRLPPPSWRMRLEKLAPPVPRQALAAYSARFGGSKEGIALPANTREGATACAVAAAVGAA